MKVGRFIPVWIWTSSPTPPLQGSLWFNNVGELRQKVGHPCARCFQWKQGKLGQDFWTCWGIISGVKHIFSFAPSGPVPKENESKKEVETGCFMFRLYLLEYLFVGELGYRNNWHLVAKKNLTWWKGLSFREQNQRYVVLLLAIIGILNSTPSPLPGNVCRGPLTLLEQSKGATQSWVLENIFPHVLSSALSLPPVLGD